MKSGSHIRSLLFTGLLLVAAYAGFGQSVSSSTSYSSTDESDGRFRYRHKANGTEFNIEMRGKIEVTDDDRDIKSMSEGGYLEINKTVFGSKRSIVIESQGGGKLKKEYYEGRTLASWDTGKEWLAEILPTVVRSTSISAEARVNRYFKQGGTTAVMAEIGRIESDGVRVQYATLLMPKAQPSDYAGIVKSLMSKMESDHYKADFLKRNIDKLLQDKASTSAVFGATMNMGSDHYKTEVIKQALRDDTVAPENVTIILQAAGRMESDHYITEVLTTLLKKSPLSDAMLSEVINTTRQIESDHYKTEVLTRALAKADLSKLSYQRVVESVKDIQSDHYITQVINDLLTRKLTDDVLANVTTIMTSIESDHYRSDVLNNLLKKQTASDNTFALVLKLCSDMNGDHYKSGVLRNALSTATKDSQVIAILQNSKLMDSDHYVAEVMLAAVPKVKAGSQPVKDAYRDAARAIDSESYYGRVMKAID